MAPGIFRRGAEFSDEGAKISFSGYYKFFFSFSFKKFFKEGNPSAKMLVFKAPPTKIQILYMLKKSS